MGSWSYLGAGGIPSHTEQKRCDLCLWAHICLLYDLGTSQPLSGPQVPLGFSGGSLILLKEGWVQTISSASRCPWFLAPPGFTVDVHPLDPQMLTHTHLRQEGHQNLFTHPKVRGPCPSIQWVGSSRSIGRWIQALNWRRGGTTDPGKWVGGVHAVSGVFGISLACLFLPRRYSQ